MVVVTELKTGGSMKEFRGHNKKLLFIENRKRVKKWLSENDDKPMKDCGIDLGLSYKTARQHIKAILAEK